MNALKSLNRHTIGFLTTHIHIGATRAGWPGILEAAVSNDANLIYFPGGRLNASDPYEAMCICIYQLVNIGQLGRFVIWTSTLATNATSEKTKVTSTQMNDFMATWKRSK